MGYSEIELGGAVICNANDSVRHFLDEWLSDSSYIVAHTSGSTGEPKEIRLLKEDMRQSALATCKWFKINDKSVMVMPLSVDYIAGKMMIVRALMSKSRLWVEEPCNQPIKQDYGMIDLLPIVPSQLQWLLDNPQLSVSVRNLIIGGGAIPSQLETKVIQAEINAYATYGMTETCSHVALRKISEPYYQALHGISFKCDDRGCLVINAPEFSFHNLVTNDIVSLENSWSFKWIGRWDNVINTGGVKVFPEKIEKIISSVLNQVDFYIVGRPSEKWGEEVVMYIENCGLDIDTENILSQIKEKLNRYELPKEIISVPMFLRTDSGKIKRLLL